MPTIACVPDDGPCVCDRQVGLTDVDAVGVRQPRDVRAIVDDDPRPGGVRHAGNLLRQRRQLRARLVLPPEAAAGARHPGGMPRPREQDQIPAPRQSAVSMMG